MRTMTISLGLGLALSLGAVDLAAQQRPARPDSAKAGAHMGPRGERGKGPTARGARMRGPAAPALLRGIALTEAQQAQLKALREQQQAARRADAEARRSAFDSARAARQSGDTAQLRAFRDQQRARMTRAREQHIAAVRGILTAEQRVQFDRNVAEMQTRLRQRQAGDRPARGPRGARGQFRGA